MSKYEIMLILDPNSDEKIVAEIAKSTFSSKDIKIERMERTELAYEINKSKTAIYVLVNVEATGEEINEFIRKANITKNIWRTMSVNLDTEKGLNRKAKPKRVKKSAFIKKTSQSKSEMESKKIDEDKKPKSEENENIEKKTKTSKKIKDESK